MTMVEFANVSKTFAVEKKLVTALDGIDLVIQRGEIFAIIGYSGAGKSTLVRLINGLESVTSGGITVAGTQIHALSEAKLRSVRRGIGMIFQQFNLLKSRSVASNVEYPLKVAGWPREKRAARVAELLEFVGLADKAKNYPDQLSGGQKQRVGIARALATSPQLLLADEATSALDPETTQDVLRLLKKVNSELGITVVVITHEMDVVRTIADRVAVLEAGRVVELGTVFEVFSEPKSTAAQSFVGSVLRNQPTSDDLARLQHTHPGRIITCAVTDSGRIGGVLSEAVSRHGVRFDIIFGGISALQDRSFGSLTLELTGSDSGVEALIGELRTVTDVHVVTSS